MSSIAVSDLSFADDGQLETALKAHRGAFVVVSHDERFLDAIGVARWLSLAGGVPT